MIAQHDRQVVTEWLPTRRALLTLLFGDKPDPLISDVQAARAANRDLDQLSARELERERVLAMVWDALDADGEIREWLIERIARIRQLQARSRYGR